MNRRLRDYLNTNANIRSRKGSSLIETIVLLSVSSTLLLIAVGWIHQSMHLATVLRDHERHHQSLMRLSRQFRDDAHAARTITGEESEVAFAMNDMTVRYQIESNVVRRSETRGSDETVHGEETYQLRDRAVVTLDLTESPQWVSLVVHRRPPHQPSGDRVADASLTSPRDLAIHAAVGRWNQDARELSNPSATQEKP